MSTGRKRELQLPVNRIKTIMRSSPNVETIGLDSLHVVTKCTELFIRYLSINGLHASASKDKLDYKGVATFANHDNKLGFLTEILPHKMKVRDIRALLANSRTSGKPEQEEQDDEEDEDDNENSSAEEETQRK
ncbi:chromatin accessibility complex protein 1 [Cimex lectularius]|uniref:Transcription factor CBF/NF-Y/archaeal histone domain-containing protein n=1 Tax=Cimex lectularius TaxID=79782 RepID=A0A8I6RPU4_CIMLE|nr:chromatin accessibility complex protein 1 [Cimex lectularius]